MDYQDKPEVYFGLARPEMMPFIPENALHILEAGCGSGIFGADLKKQNPARRVEGIEPDGKSVRLAQQVLDSVFEGSVEAFIQEHAKDRKYDCIIFNDVLEHLYDPGAVLKSCREMLNPGGCIVSSIPNIRYFPVFVQYIKHAEWKYAEAGVMDFTHMRFFTQKSMIRMYQEAGYRIDKIQGINPTKSSAYPLFNMITLGKFPDVKYQQFAIRAVPV